MRRTRAQGDGGAKLRRPAMTSSKDDSSVRLDDAPVADDLSLTPAPAVLLRGIEPAMATLFDEWLTRDGLRVLRHAAANERIGLILIDLPFPRQDGAQRLQQLAQAWPGVPVLALSSAFFAGVAAQGDVARQLGAAAVLAAPVARETLRAAVAKVLQRGPVA
jgi:CheY-like chemotaxis protein